MIDGFYSDIDKSYYYLGMVSQVYRDNIVIQVENLLWLNFRRLKNNILIPGTINYYVLIDSVNGIFIGEVTQAKLPGNENVHNYLMGGKSENIFPEIYVDIISVYSEKYQHFVPVGFSNVELANNVYVANDNVMECFFASLETNIESVNEKYIQ